MLKKKHKLTPQDIKKNRRRYKMKNLIAASNERKIVLYVFRSNKNLHLNLLQNGLSIVSENTITLRRENSGILRRDLLPKMVESFVKKLCDRIPNFKLSQLVIDISYYQYKGNIKLCVDAIREKLIQTIRKSNTDNISK